MKLGSYVLETKTELSIGPNFYLCHRRRILNVECQKKILKRSKKKIKFKKSLAHKSISFDPYNITQLKRPVSKLNFELKTPVEAPLRALKHIKLKVFNKNK